MATLNWIGKEAVAKHHLDVPFHLLKDVPSLSCGDPGTGNLILQADNLVGLKALLPYYAGEVKCIAIDPPYNTGNEGWAYNDNVKSPAITRWLGEVVGKEGETLDRHDRWLCMMYPRLVLLRQFLTEDGAIFVFLDDNEVHTVRFLLDEIFGAQNFFCNFVWQSKDTPGNNSTGVAETHNHIIVYRKADQFVANMLDRDEKQIANYKNPDKDVRGSWLAAPLTRGEHRERDFYALTNPAGEKVFPPAGTCWRRPPETMKTLALENRIWWGKKGDSRFPMEKKFLSEAKDGVVNRTWWPYEFAGSTRNAGAEIKELFGKERVFDTPKPTRVIERIIQIATNPGDLVLDSFGGSGTTAHAVLKTNAANPDKSPRRFIMIEMEEKIAREVTAERVRRVAEGYKNVKGEDVPGLGGGFRFCELGEELFDSRMQIRETVKFADLARHVYFIETGEPLPKSRVLNTPFLGVHNGRAVCLLYNGILKDKSPQGGNALTHETLSIIKDLCPEAERTVVYGTSQRVAAARLKRAGIEFKQIPYSLT